MNIFEVEDKSTFLFLGNSKKKYVSFTLKEAGGLTKVVSFFSFVCIIN